MNTVCMLRAVVAGLAFSLMGLLPVAGAVEEGELVRKDGRWEYVTRGDPALNYLLQKGLITREEYDQGAHIIEMREHSSAPPFSINYSQGLNITPEDERFFLKLRGQYQFRLNHNMFNEAWNTIGDNHNQPHFVGGETESRRVTDDTATTMSNQVMRLKFLGYAFDPNLRFDFTIGADRHDGNPIATGAVRLVNAFVTSWHLPYANVVVGQYKTWFNRSAIQSIMSLSFATRMIVQNAFTANVLNRRDIGITLLSDETKYRFNYQIGVFGGEGISLDGLSMTPARNANELMYVGRLLWNVAGHPLYGEGDIQWSRTPQVAIAVGYAYNPAVNLTVEELPTRMRDMLLWSTGNGRLLGAGILDFQTWAVDFIAKYRGWALQAEGYYRQQEVRGHIPPGTPRLGDATGWYAQLGYYLVPRKLEVAARYGVFDPSTAHPDDLVKEAGVALNYSLDGTYDHRLIVDYTHVTMGTGGFSAGRQIVSTQDLISNGVRVLYQYFW